MSGKAQSVGRVKILAAAFGVAGSMGSGHCLPSDDSPTRLPSIIYFCENITLNNSKSSSSVLQVVSVSSYRNLTYTQV